MTRDDDGKVVCRARAGDRTHRFRQSDTPSDFGVGHLRANRNLLQRLPYPLLEGRAANIDRHIQLTTRRFDKANDPCDECLIITIGGNEPRVPEAILEIADEGVGIVAEKDRRDAFRARSDENGTANSARSRI